MLSSGDCFVLFGIVLRAWEIQGDPLQGCCRGHNKWYQSFQVSLGISADSEGTRSDSVEIVCRSQIRGIGVRGIVCRSQEDARRAHGICVEVDQK